MKSIIFLIILIASCAQGYEEGLRNKLQSAALLYCNNPSADTLFTLQNFLNAHEGSLDDRQVSYARAVLDGTINCQESKFKKTVTTDSSSIICPTTPVDVKNGTASITCSFSFELDEGIYLYEIYGYIYSNSGYLYNYPSNYYWYDNSASTTVQSGTIVFTLPQYAPNGTWTVQGYVYSINYDYYQYSTSALYVKATKNDQGPPVLKNVTFPIVDTASSLTAYIPFIATDDLTGVVEFYTYFYDTSYSTYLGYAYWYYSSTPQVYISTIAQAYLNNVPFGSYIAIVYLYDAVGFYTYYYPDNLQASGLPSTIINAGNNCSAGYYLPAGASGPCKQCPAGTYSLFGSIACTPCPPGTKGNGKGATSCIQCAAGYFSNGGTSACQLCTAGHYSSSAGTAVCSSCQPGTYVSTTGATTCIGCPAGTKSCAGATTCAACAAGSYSNGYASYCTQCQAGTYAASTGSTSCTPCPVGTYAGKVGATSCTSCPAGETSPAGSVSLVACD